MRGFYISAAHKSSGKTTLSIGLGAALKQKGHVVQPFKKGPDYIDPMWLRLATERRCYNLDFYTQTTDEIQQLVHARSSDASVVMVEGNKGLFDGLDIEGSNSNAAMAKYLDLPVILVLDTVGTIRGLAPLVLGYQAFDPDINIAGVILNKVGGPRHETKLRQVMETYTDVPVLGAVGRGDEVRLLERHLGLVPSNEENEAREKVDRIASTITESVDLDRLLEVSPSMIDTPPTVARFAAPERHPRPSLKVGIARDAAFGFYYSDDLDRMRVLGAELVNIDMLNDEALPPDLDGLFIGGGFPESFAKELEANVGMRASIAEAIEQDLPVYAECGGLMYMARELVTKDGAYDMVGAVPGRCVMHAKPVGRGYTRLEAKDQDSWAYHPEAIKAHEFHYSDLEWESTEPLQAVHKVARGHGIDGEQDGFRYRNLLAGYHHMRNTRDFPWCDKFIEFVRSCKSQAARLEPVVERVMGD